MKVFHIEVDTPVRGWVRVGGPYRTRETANSWRKFVKAFWYATRSRVVVVYIHEEHESEVPL